MEGVARGQVRLLPHDPGWEREFFTVEAELYKAWGDNCLDIQHVGSTAVPAICAKPILDVAVRLHSIRAMDTRALEALGYGYCGARHGNEDHHLFVLRGGGELSLRHIHCYDQSEPEFFRLVGFRDYLNAHPEAATQYQALKLRLAEQYPTDRARYAQEKEDFVQAIYSRL